MKILIITPACNEEKHLPALIDSVLSQSYLPVEWIIVDDGSKDNTSNVIQHATMRHDWIKYLRKENANVRAPGKNVMEAFYFGFNNRDAVMYDVVIKLDADLVLPVNYLEVIIQKFKTNPQIGICGGVCVVQNGSKYTIEQETNLDHVRGAIKAYRRECFDAIDGLLKHMGWDTVDEHSARFHGWLVSVLPELQVIHQRSTHQEYGFIKAAFRNGKMLYSIRMDIFLLFGNCIKKSLKQPYLILGIAMFIGYVSAFFTRYEKIVGKDLGRFIRKYRYEQILKKLSI